MNSFLNSIEKVFYSVVKVIGGGIAIVLGLIPFAIYIFGGYIVALFISAIPTLILDNILPDTWFDYVLHSIATFLCIGFILVNIPRDRTPKDDS